MIQKERTKKTTERDQFECLEDVEGVEIINSSSTTKLGDTKHFGVGAGTKGGNEGVSKINHTAQSTAEAIK